MNPPEVRCADCGRTPRPDETPGASDVPWTWSTGGGDQRDVLCDGCTRQHARSIEAKLEPEWW